MTEHDNPEDVKVELSDYKKYCTNPKIGPCGINGFLEVVYDDFIQGEGKLNDPYLCKNGYPTIGVGALFFDPKDPELYRSRYVGFKLYDKSGNLMSLEEKNKKYDELIECMKNGSITTKPIPYAGRYLVEPYMGYMKDDECERVLRKDARGWYISMKDVIPNLEQYPIKAQLAIVHMGFGGLKNRLNDNLKDVDRNDPEAVMAVVENICRNVKVSDGLLKTVSDARKDIATIKAAAIADKKMRIELANCKDEIETLEGANTQKSTEVAAAEVEALSEVKAVSDEKAVVAEKEERLARRKKEFEGLEDDKAARSLMRVSANYPNIVGRYEKAANNEDIEQINGNIGVCNSHIDNATKGLSDINTSISMQNDALSSMGDGGANADIKAQLEAAKRKLAACEVVGTSLNKKEGYIEDVIAETGKMKALLGEKTEKLEEKEKAFDDYQLVFDYATLSRKEIIEKYGCTPKDLKKMIDEIESGARPSPELGKDAPIVEAELTSDYGISEAERTETVDVMEVQRVEADKKYAKNVSQINNGTYGDDIAKVVSQVEGRETAVETTNEVGQVDSASKTAAVTMNPALRRILYSRA
jgi:hypothetical protein